MDADFHKRNQFNDINEIKKNWRNLEDNIKTIAFGDGYSSGRDSTFQHYFNQGFFEGFKSSYTVGEYRGSLNFQHLSKKDLCKQDVLIAKAAWCQICCCKELLERNISDVITLQSEAHSKYLQQMERIGTQKT